MSALNDDLAFQLTALGIEYEREYVALRDRKFAWDFRVGNYLIEIQGGIYMRKGGHNTGRGIARDCEKANLANLAGWHTLFFTGEMVRDGSAARDVLAAVAVGEER